MNLASIDASAPRTGDQRPSWDFLTHHATGRRNVYEVEPGLPLRHPLVAERGVGELLEVLHGPAPGSGR